MKETTNTLSPRRWWRAALLGFFGIGAGYLYVGRPRTAVTVAVVFLLVSLALYTGTGGAAARPIVFYGLALTAFLLLVWAVIAPAVIAARTRDYYVRPINRWWIYLGAIAATIAYSNILIQFDPAVRTFRVSSISGLPTVRPGDMVFADMTAYAHVGPARGDLVLFAKHTRYPDGHEKPYLSRVIGLPGDRIELVEGIVIINGQKVETKAAGGATPAGRDGIAYDETLTNGVHYQILRRDFRDNRSTTAEHAVAPGCYFLLGDNRDNAVDSREYGDICREQIVGQPRWIVWSSDWARLGTRLD